MRIVLLSGALLIAASNAAAVPLDLSNPNGIAALYVVHPDPSCPTVYVVCTDGTGFMGSACVGAAWQPFNPSPVPLSEVADWTPWALYTADGEWWGRRETHPSSDNARWAQMGPPPCSMPVGASGKSLGDVKSLFR